MKPEIQEGRLTNPRLGGVDPPSQESADLLGALWRYRWAVILPGIAGMVLGFLVYLRTPETYRSTTRLMLESDRPAILDSMTGDLVGGVPSIDIVESQLYSDRVVSMAFDDPRMQPFRERFSDSPSKYISSVQKQMVLEPEVADTGTAQSLVMLLHFDSRDAELSEASVKSFSTALQTFLNERHKNSQSDLVSLISEAMETLHPKMLELERRYRDFRRDAPLAWNAKGEAINPHRERSLFLIQRRSEIFEQLRQKQILLSAVESVATKSEDPMVALSVVGQLLGIQIQVPEPQPITAGSAAREGDATLALLDVDKELLPLMIDRNKYAAEFGDNHPTVKQLDAELTTMKLELKRLVKEQTDQIIKLMADNKQELSDPTQRAQEAIKAVLYAAKSEVMLLQKQIDEVDEQISLEKEQTIELARFEQDNFAMLREIERDRELMDQLEEQMARVSLTNDQQSSTRVIELTAPSRAYLVGPILLKLLGIGSIIGLTFGTGLAMILEKNASTFRTPDEVTETLGVPVLTHLPFFKGRISKPKTGELNPFKDLDAHLATIHQPASVVSEAIRSLRTSLFCETGGQGCKIIQVTSPLPGDGKSTIAGNLACSIAQSGKRVLAVDCDLRRPQLTDNFSLSSELGITSVLNAECEPDDAIHQTPLANLKVMPSGPIPANPAEALTLPDMGELLEYFRTQYDYVIIDTPPMLVVTDPSIIASMVDGVVLGLRIRRKSKQNSRESINILRTVGANIFGIVINNSDESGASDGYRGYGYYRYGRYTSRYYRPGSVKKGGAQSRGVVVSGKRNRSPKPPAISTPESSVDAESRDVDVSPQPDSTLSP